MILTLIASLLLSAMAGTAAGAVFVLWPRRRTAESWVLHRREMETSTTPPQVRSSREWLTWMASTPFGSAVQADLGLLRVTGQSAPDETAFLRRLLVLAVSGGLGGALLVLLMAIAAQTSPSPIAFLLPPCLGLLLPAIQWIGVRRQASRLRDLVSRRLPRSLIAARVLLESGVATPEGALIDVVSVYQDPAAELIAEALRIKEVHLQSLEDALADVSNRFHVAPLAKLADSIRVGVRYGTPMAGLLAKQSAQLRDYWYTSYRQRIVRAPVTMTIPALIFFVVPILTLILIMVFVPLVGSLGQF